jgi:SAM-dependent methyltransferase
MQNQKPEEKKPFLAAQDHVYLQCQADLDVTKHLGGRAATLELLELCHFSPGMRVLDVGCGVGYTAIFLAKTHGCQVTAVDAFDRMIDRAHERVRRAGVEDKVELRVADAQSLTFEDGPFDVVLCESVLPFVPDQAKALREFARVARTGGWVGINETTWTQEPAPGEREAIEDALGGPAAIGNTDYWRGLLLQAGLHDVAVRMRPVTSRSEVIARVKQAGLAGTARIFWRGYRLARSRPEYGKLIRKTLGERTLVSAHWACGLFAGQK